MEDFISYILSIAAGRADQLRAALRRCAYGYARGAHRSGARRIWRRRTGAHRQCRGQSKSARCLRQYHHGGDADVFRPPAASARRCGAVSHDRTARRAGGKAGARARCRHLGISRAHSACTRIRRRCAGPAVNGWRRSRTTSIYPIVATYWGGIANRIGEQVLKRAWNPKRKAFTASFDGEDLDASALLLAELGLVQPDDPRFVATVETISSELRREQPRYEICRRRRFWPSGDGVFDLPVLVDRCIVGDWPAG